MCTGHVGTRLWDLSRELYEIGDAARRRSRSHGLQHRPTAYKKCPTASKAQRILRERDCVDKRVLSLLKIEPRNADEGKGVCRIAQVLRPRQFRRVDRIRLNGDGEFSTVESLDIRLIRFRKRDQP